MKKRNVFELLALKEKISANNYSKKLQSLSEESSKVTKILNQLEELSENRENSNFLPAWQLKSSANKDCISGDFDLNSCKQFFVLAIFLFTSMFLSLLPNPDIET